MLYRFGKGVPINQAFSGALFSQASSQGHSDATKMLDTINLS
jgi:TPR repeat protein